jgi:hypothetical protein
MSVILNASTSSGLVQTADTSGNLELQSNGSTKLTVNSTGVTATSIQGTIVQGTAVASTSGTSIDFTSIPSWVKKITVMFSGVSTSGTSPVQIQLGTGSTTYTTTGYISTGALWGSGGVATILTNTSGLVTAGDGGANYVRNGSFVISLLTSNTWVLNGGHGDSSTSRVTVAYGSIALAAALTAVRITTVNGTDTFDAGSINIQYEG